MSRRLLANKSPGIQFQNFSDMLMPLWFTSAFSSRPRDLFPCVRNLSIPEIYSFIKDKSVNADGWRTLIHNLGFERWFALAYRQIVFRSSDVPWESPIQQNKLENLWCLSSKRRNSWGIIFICHLIIYKN